MFNSFVIATAVQTLLTASYWAKQALLIPGFLPPPEAVCFCLSCKSTPVLRHVAQPELRVELSQNFLLWDKE